MLTGSLKGPDDFEEGDFRKGLPRFNSEVRSDIGDSQSFTAAQLTISPLDPTHPPQNFPKNLELVNKLKAIADKKGCTPGQLTLAWLLAQGDDIIPIPGTLRVSIRESG